MKTKQLFLLVVTIVISSCCCAQEVSEQDTIANFLSYIDFSNDTAEVPALVQSRAVFKPRLNYQNMQEFLNQHIQFPEEAKALGVSGSVIAHFEIRWDGSLGDIYFIQTPDKLFSEEVERVLRMAQPFIPAIKDGKISSSYELVKVSFTLE